MNGSRAMSEQYPVEQQTERERSARDVATLVYLIQAISIFTAVPFFVGVIINYAKRGDVRGTLAESHFRWQIRTFWYSLLWFVIGWATVWILIGFVVWGISWIWVVYRVVRGWLNLADNRPAYS
ncbi:DUF4870 family protein [Microbulbifer agarilyticus]|uniref:DUF4870 family protein n=1 Tax=Microbulbifer agarilyticus TaxID=260552 RepID=UPI001CD1BDFB|nr:hypothetical protein [Microbulbifer agarilyticus]MCA0893173.1 hypothetical protein [Microbulbifer agarilyticus]